MQLKFEGNTINKTLIKFKQGLELRFENFKFQEVPFGGVRYEMKFIEGEVSRICLIKMQFQYTHFHPPVLFMVMFYFELQGTQPSVVMTVMLQ